MKNWEECNLEDYIKLIDYRGRTPVKTESGVRLITAKNVKLGYLQLEPQEFIATENYDSWMSRGIPNYGDVIFTTEAPLANVAQIDTNEKLAFAQRIIVMQPNPKKIDQTFLKWMLLSENTRQKILEKGTGATVTGIKSSLLKKIRISFPPLPEQQRIVSILDECFAAIDKAKANAELNLKNAKELLDVFLHKYFTNKEDGWEEKKLKDVAEYFNGLTYSPKDVSDKGIIVLRSSNIQDDKLDFDDIVRVTSAVKEKIIVRDGDILMCSRNGSKRLVGKTAPIENLPEQMTFGTFMMIIRSEYNPYLLWFFKSLDFKKQISGGENTMINQITRYMLDDVIVSFPPFEKQLEIVQQLDSIYKESQKLESIYQKKLTDLEELKKSILQKAFGGELKTEIKVFAEQV